MDSPNTIITGSNSSGAGPSGAPTMPPPPPGYSASDIVAVAPATAPTPSNVPPPPPGYAAADIVPSGTPASTSTPAATSTLQTAPVATMSAIQQPTGTLDHIQRWANNVADDIRYGTNRTGIGSLLKDLGAKGLDYGNNDAVSDFMGSLPLGVLKAIKGGAEYFNPQQKVSHALGDIVGGGLQAATIPSAFVSPEAGELGAEGITSATTKVGELASNAGSAVADVAGKGAKTVMKPFSLKAVQEALANAKEATQQGLQNNLTDIQNGFHESIRSLFDDVAHDAGVQPKPAQSLNDIAANTAAAIKAKASSLYKQLDNAVGGTRFQTFDEQLSNVKRALRNSAGIDPDADGRLTERINQLEDAKTNALEQAKAAGVDPNLIHEANSTHRQAMALQDLSKHLRASMSGLRADLAQGVNAAPEALSPVKLAPRANRLYNTGRLQQAIGDDRADELLQSIEGTKQAQADATAKAVKQAEADTANAAKQASAVKIKRAAGAVGLGLVAHNQLGWLLKHLLFE